MLKKNKWRLGAVTVAVTAALALGATPALADPSGFKALSGTGSDTTQDVLNGLASTISTIGSYDATGSATIQTKSGGPTYNRPNGSTAGIQALSASINSTGTKLWQTVAIDDQLDFARSSSGPSSSFVGTQLTFIPFGRDAVTYAVNAGSDFPRSLPLGSAAAATANPNALTLWNIYHCTRTTYTNADSEQVTIRPLIPQSGSGTRSFWLTTVGLTEATLGTFPCVTSLSNTVQEHSGVQVTGAGDIVPFSIAQWVAQGNHSSIQTTTGVSVSERRANVALGSIGGVKPMVVGASGAELNSAFPVNRSIYNVVETARLAESNIASTFVGASSSVCQASAIIRQFGFATIANCGATTSTSGYYL